MPGAARAPRPRGGRVGAALAALLAAASSQAPGQPVAPPAEPPFTWSGVYKADLLHADSPSLDTANGHLNLAVDVDGEASLGWPATTLHGELLWNHGGKANRRIRTTQGLSNIEVARNAARVYAAWIEHRAAGGHSFLFGLYDLNSEFYATDASGLLIHPSFGIGYDFSQSGRNGPSIFPNLGLSLRWRLASDDGRYVQAAIIDGVPGDPDDPGRTTVHLSRNEGALLVSEAGWAAPATSAPAAHWGVGVWRYTATAPPLDGGPARHDAGLYGLMQLPIGAGGPSPATGFLRAGVANRQVHAVDVAADCGLLIERPWQPGGPRALTIGVATVRYGRPQRAQQLLSGTRRAASETTFEIGLRWEVAPGLEVQPLLQSIRHPGGDLRTVTVAGVRGEWRFGPARP